MALPLIIDCDPGVDDAVALLLAFGSEELNVLGVTTVAGNVNAKLTARNARVIREIAAREDVPVFAGATHALMGSAVEAEHFHGETGLGWLTFSEPRAGLAEGSSAEFIVRTLRAADPRSVTIAVLGPLTNLAIALALAPEIKAAIREIVIMGGARTAGGNITASAEYNIYADAHAAHLVLSSGAPAVVIGLDATHQVRTNAARIARLAGIRSAKAAAAVELFRFGEDVELRLAGRAGAPLHDPSIIAYVLRRDLFVTEPCAIRVETASDITRGHTAVEFRLNAPSHLCWATEVNADGLFDLLAEKLA